MKYLEVMINKKQAVTSNSIHINDFCSTINSIKKYSTLQGRTEHHVPLPLAKWQVFSAILDHNLVALANFLKTSGSFIEYYHLVIIHCKINFVLMPPGGATVTVLQRFERNKYFRQRR